MSEYLRDYFISSSKRAIKTHKESIWEFIHDLITIFKIKNPLSHPLFQQYPPTKIHQKGLNHLITYYPDRLKRIKKVYLQEVLKVK